jgi:hypothetical protein
MSGINYFIQNILQQLNVKVDENLVHFILASLYNPLQTLLNRKRVDTHDSKNYYYDENLELRCSA